MNSSLVLHRLACWKTAGKNLLLGAALLLPVLARAQVPVQTGGSMSVNGGGGVINGDGQSGYFVQAGSLSISNATLANFNSTGGNGSGGGAGLGGALFINNGGTVTLNNVNFISDTAQGGAGGVGNVGGSLNNLFNNGTVPAPAASGTTPTQISFTDIGGTTGTVGLNGAINSSGVGGAGGMGGNGGAGGTMSTTLILSVTTASLALAADVAAAVADYADPFTWPRTIGDTLILAADAVDLANQVTALTDFDQSLADGQIGLGGPGGNGGSGGIGSDFNGGGAGGAGGTGGAGGYNWSGSAFQGGAAGGSWWSWRCGWLGRFWRRRRCGRRRRRGWHGRQFHRFPRYARNACGHHE